MAYQDPTATQPTCPAWTDDFSAPGTSLSSARFLNLFVDKWNGILELVNQSWTSQYGNPNPPMPAYNASSPSNLVSYEGEDGNPDDDLADSDYPWSQGRMLSFMQSRLDYNGRVGYASGLTGAQADTPSGFYLYISPSSGSTNVSYDRDAFRTGAGIKVDRSWRRRRNREIVALSAPADVWGNPAQDGMVARLTGVAWVYYPFLQNAGVPLYTYAYNSSAGSWLPQPPGNTPDQLDSDQGQMCGGHADPGDLYDGHAYNQLRDAMNLLLAGYPAGRASGVAATPMACNPTPQRPGSPTATPITACTSCVPCCFTVGASSTWTPPCNGTLRFVVNDVVGQYGNNLGQFVTSAGTVAGNDPVGRTFNVSGGTQVTMTASGVVTNEPQGQLNYVAAGPAGVSSNLFTGTVCPGSPFLALVAVFTPSGTTTACGICYEGHDQTFAVGDSILSSRCFIAAQTCIDIGTGGSGTFTDSAGSVFEWSDTGNPAPGSYVRDDPPPGVSDPGAGVCTGTGNYISVTRTA